MSFGLVVKEGSGSKRLEMQCKHQNGLLYIVRSQGSWVCQEEHLHAHALAGFFKELVNIQDERIKKLMSRWGLYFRERPLTSQSSEDSET